MNRIRLLTNSFMNRCQIYLRTKICFNCLHIRNRSYILNTSFGWRWWRQWRHIYDRNIIANWIHIVWFNGAAGEWNLKCSWFEYWWNANIKSNCRWQNGNDDTWRNQKVKEKITNLIKWEHRKIKIHFEMALKMSGEIYPFQNESQLISNYLHRFKVNVFFFTFSLSLSLPPSHSRAGWNLSSPYILYPSHFPVTFNIYQILMLNTQS